MVSLECEEFCSKSVDRARINTEWGGSINTQLRKESCRREGKGGGQSMVNLERICKDIARITSDNVDPGGSINGQLGKDLQRHCKDYL